jgi:L-alanine-DL-glutamate epimerase-like enolase superfamily enzyme
MRIETIETIELPDHPNLCWVEVGTDTGVVGLGETFYAPGAVVAYIHDIAAGYLLGQDPLDIERHATALRPRHGFMSDGAEMRGNSALNIALWDIFSKTVGLPLAAALGGFSRRSIGVYNTCAGSRYLRATAGLVLDRAKDRGGQWTPVADAADDPEDFVRQPGDLARRLVGEGYAGMKIWPFDRFAEANGGVAITARQLAEGVETVAAIREAVGHEIEIMMEFHGLWDLTSALRIARELEPFAPAWYEDLVRPTDIDALGELRRHTRVPICASELLGPKSNYRPLLEARAADIVMIDPVWCGGITEARKIANAAESYSRVITMHDCTGPVALATGFHVSLHVPNASLQEVARAQFFGWYQEVCTGLPALVDGRMEPTAAAGHGVELRKETRDRGDAVRRVSTVPPR